MIYRDLRDALGWFRVQWQADLPAKLHVQAVHIANEDHLGGPAMTERFERYIDSGVMWVGDEVWQTGSPKGLLRLTLCRMAQGSGLERQAARFLFVLACQGFDPDAAGRAMSPPISPEYAPYYAEKAIGRLQQRMEQTEERKRLPWQVSGEYREIPMQRAVRVVG